MRRLSHACSLAALLQLAMAAGCVDASQRMATCPTGTGTAPATGSSGGAKGCSAGTRPAADGAIDDFEDGDSQLSKSSDRDGYWFTSHDPSGSTIGPNPLKMAGEGAGGSQKSLHVTGQTASSTDAWGVLFGANFLGKGLYDASKFAGISFKAKVAGSSTKKVRFKVGDVNTHPDGTVCKSCWNHFGKDLVFTTEWAEYQVSFAEMKQEPGWGDRRPAVTPAELISLNWSIGPGQAFDLWIDDIQFFECM